MATVDDIKLLIQAIADGIDDNGSLGLRTPGPAVVVAPNVEVKPGESWGEAKAFEIYLGGIAEYIDGISAKDKINELIAQYNQLRVDYNNGVVPTSAAQVDPIP
ncbi:MAG: hypothetical protein GY841_15690 [FCB group bacterium]|nr:hypothetical protein [FCB group bacterium]